MRMYILLVSLTRRILEYTSSTCITVQSSCFGLRLIQDKPDSDIRTYNGRNPPPPITLAFKHCHEASELVDSLLCSRSH